MQIPALLTALQVLDWRTPWRWPRTYRRVALVLAALAAWLLGGIGWFDGWQAWQDALAAQEKLQAQQRAVQALHQQTQQIQQSLRHTALKTADVHQLTASVPPRSLQVSQISVGSRVQTPAMRGMQLAQLPMQLQLQGTWTGLQQWLMQWPHAAPGVTLASLVLKAQPHGGVKGELVALAPHTEVHARNAFSTVTQGTRSVTADAFDASHWIQTQREHAQQHPSYAQRVMPQLRRPREALEAYGLEQLHYVGHIAAGSRLQGLLRVVDTRGSSSNAQPTEGLLPIHRVSVGAHVGPHFGRVQAITSDHVVIQELVLEPQGEWVYRQAQLALQERTP